MVHTPVNVMLVLKVMASKVAVKTSMNALATMAVTLLVHVETSFQDMNVNVTWDMIIITMVSVMMSTNVNLELILVLPNLLEAVKIPLEALNVAVTSVILALQLTVTATTRMNALLVKMIVLMSALIPPVLSAVHVEQDSRMSPAMDTIVDKSTNVSKWRPHVTPMQYALIPLVHTLVHVTMVLTLWTDPLRPTRSVPI